MKYLKILGLAAVAVAALMAFVGAGSASAATLCHEKAEPCPAGKMYGPGVGDIPSIHAELKAGTIATLKAGFATVKCEESTVLGDVEKTGENTSATNNPGGPVTVLTFNNASCNCEVTVLKNGSLSVAPITGSNNGTVTSSGASVTINCSGVSCIFGTAAGGTDLGTLTAGADPVIDINAKVVYQTGDASNSICTLGTGTGSWTGEYTLTTSAFVTEM